MQLLYSLSLRELGPLIIKDFCPISLVGGVYKITSKVPASRLKTVLEKVISRSQNAFIRGRQILDSVMVANEFLDCQIRLGEPGVLCKLDLGKASYRVNWDFSSACNSKEFNPERGYWIIIS